MLRSAEQLGKVVDGSLKGKAVVDAVTWAMSSASQSRAWVACRGVAWADWQAENHHIKLPRRLAYL